MKLRISCMGPLHCFSYKCCCLIILLVLVSFIACVAAAKASELQPEDCGKCHAFQLKMISEAGSKHATDVGCLDCHPRHPPQGNAMTACSLCHAGQPHFEIGDCLHCHTDAHKPLASLRDPLKPTRKECLSCHLGVGELMALAPSRHAELFCNRCHNGHKEIPVCLDCHGSHLEEQSARDCLRCHSAHQPLRIFATSFVPASFCKVCHAKEASDLADTNTNHGGINCTYCHKGAHPSTPACQECHGLPHAKVIHNQHRQCLECHEDAHRLVSRP